MPGFIVTIAILPLAERSQAQARNTVNSLYVAVGGSSSQTRAVGLNNPNKPYDTIQHACQNSMPDDTIIVNAGTYTDSAYVSNCSYLTVRPATGASVVLKGTSANNFAIAKIDGSNHILFQSFEVNGTGAGADAGGITIVPRTNGAVTTPSLNIQVKYCKVHDCGGGGIYSNSNSTYTIGCDYVEITGNEIYNCLSSGSINGSAISLHQDRNSNTSDTGFHSIIQTNKIHDNINQNSDTVAADKKHTDGNGIIIDTTQNGATTGPRILIQNNLVYGNGGRGIHVFESSNVTVLNNTLYGNDLDPNLQFGGGELSAVTVSNVFFSNNMVQGNGKASALYLGAVSGTTNGSGILFKNNTYGGAGTNVPAANIDWPSTISFDWATVLPFVNATTKDFHLKSLGAGHEVALNKGSSVSGEYATYSLDSPTPRIPTGGTAPGGAVDRGAYEQ